MAHDVRRYGDGILSLRISSPLRHGEAVSICKAIMELSEHDDVVRILVDIEDLKDVSTLVAMEFSTAVQMIGQPRPNLVAIIGANQWLRSVVRFVVRWIPQTISIRFFSEEEEAVQWLRESAVVIPVSSEGPLHEAPVA